MEGLSMWGGVLGARKSSQAMIALFAAFALFASLSQSASAKGGGQIGEAWGTPGTGNGQLFNPAMFGADSTDGTVYTGDYTGTVSTETSNYRIQQLSAGGEFKASAEIKRFPVTKKIIGLQGIAVDHSLGRIYMVESCRVSALGGTFTCKETGGKFAARKILVYSTTPEGAKLVPDKTTPTIALPEGEKEIYSVQAIAVDPSNHDILLLGEENAGHKIVQRVSSAGVLGARFTDTSDVLKPSAGGGEDSFASSLAVAPSGTAYTVTGLSSPGRTFTRAWQLPSSLASVEAVPGFASAAEKEGWPLGHVSKVEATFGGPQLAISTDGGTLYWKEYKVNSGGPSEAGELLVRGYSISKGESTAIWGGGSSKCKITTSNAALAATSSGNLAVLDTGAETAKPGDKPAYGLKTITFGASGTGCVEPIAKFTVNGKKEGEEPTGIKPGDTVSFDASSSELAGGFRKELIWKFGDGTEKTVVPAKEGEEASATVTHVYSSAAKVTVRLEVKLLNPPFGDPAPVERTFTVGTPAKPKFKLKVAKSGTGTGTVSSTPSGINCDPTCEAEFDEGTEVTLSQSADPGSEFKGWSGACSGTGACKVTMSAAKSVGAEFALEKHLLSVSETGSGTGKVTSSPGGIDCGTTCSASFDHNVEVTLTPSADPGSEFKGWSGACSGTGACKVTMSAAKSVGAEFVATSSFLLTVKKAGSGYGPVTSSPAGIDCHTTCAASFSGGSTVTLSGEPGPGSKLAWSGCDAIVGANECKVTMSGAREVVATFEEALCTGANIVGAGSSLQRIAQTEVWKVGFEGTICNSGTHPTVTYNSVGSGAGMSEWNFDGTKGSINTGVSFIGTDDAPTAAQIANIKSKAGGAQLAVIPVAQTSIAILANPPAGCEVEAITNSNLAGVFEGRIANWGGLEGAEGTCDSPIARVVRKDGSGTTYQLKNYLFQLYKKGLSCTVGATEGKQSWQELEAIGAAGAPNVSWPESCTEKPLSPVVRPAGNGGGEVVSTVNATPGSIGYAALPDAKAGASGGTTILALQNNGQKKGGEANFANAASGTTANCGSTTYTGFKLNTNRDVDWSGVFGAKPAVGGKGYPLCALTYALAFHGYSAAGFSEGQEVTARDYLNGYVVRAAGQAAVAGHFYSPLPTSAESKFDVLGAARWAASSINY
jgi:ABC-type phosphate transport system substrate-binding protein